MSVKKDIFTVIGAHLMATVLPITGREDLPDLPGLQWFDKQMGQFDSPELSYAVPLPVVLLEYGQFTWTTIGQNQQKGEGTLRFYIYFENYANSFDGSLNQDMALCFWEFTEMVHLALQGFGIKDKMSALERIGDAEDIAQDMVITSVMEYSATIYDNSTDRGRNFIDVEPDVTVEYKRKSSRPPGEEEKAFLL